MPALPTELLSTYESEVATARDVAEAAAAAALTILAVAEPRPFDALTEPQRARRRALRARARQLGGGDQDQGMPQLIEEIAYEQWHQLLFTRFLAENQLLMHPEGVAVTLEECAELAPEEGAEDRWELAARYAVAMLPGIFNLDDPAMQVQFAPEDQKRLEEIITGLPRLIFTSDDGLGWAYQFWQSKKKDEVNASEGKIGGANIAPVTQLFTEDYIVKFLLHNSLGAWWAARYPDSPLLASFDYLRFREDGTPAAGTFDGWPDTAAEVTVMDPAMGSGHFLVAAFEMLTQMRMEEEGLSKAEAGDAVIQDNIFGLEIDPRCTQIAAFNLALAAWKAGGYRELPLPNVACSGIPVEGQLEQWLRLAENDVALQRMMERLHRLFRNAPDLGSLIDPSYVPIEERMFVGDYEHVKPLLEQALQQEMPTVDPAAALFGKAVEGMVRATQLLSNTYILVVTNVPYLTYVKQTEVLKRYCEEKYPEAKADLATAFVERCRAMTKDKQSYALVTPQNWLFLGLYKTMRETFLREQRWLHVSWLGPGAFRTISGEVVKPVLLFMSNQPAEPNSVMTGIDAAVVKSADEKADLLKHGPLETISQHQQIRNPDSRITLHGPSRGRLLSAYAESYQGICTGDYARFGRYFWELPELLSGWVLQQSTVASTESYQGRQNTLFWQEGKGELHKFLVERLGENGLGAWVRGLEAWGRKGVAINQMGSLSASIYAGDCFDNNIAVIVPHDTDLVPALWAFCSSPQFSEEVRRIDRKINVTNKTLLKVPFDLDHWSAVATEQYPGGLPEPYSDDPTQWLFEGHPAGSTEPLQVAVARLAGYQWPEQEDDDLTAMADADGILCLPAVAGEPPAAERLRALLAHAYGAAWTPQRQRQLLADVDFADKSLDDWLRDGCFIQHCKLFGNRPFIWHIWDGRSDGFSALVNYHKLDTATLEKLIYTYLGDWIRTQQAQVDREVAGAEGRLVAALELQQQLEAILEGEPPYDIYVRWKALHEQPVGWDPDLNDGVRLNIRPFVEAGVLRRKFTIHWKKDRGKNPDGSLRHNDRHTTRAEKLAARKARGSAS